MKAFQTYIFELNKPYEFRVKLAATKPEGEVMDRIKNALDAYQLESISAVKSLPIQEHREFSQHGPCECWTFDIKVAYPVIAAQLRQTIKERALIDASCISVRNLHEEEDTTEAEARGKDHEGALLTDGELKADPEGQSLAGQARVGSLLKELESRQFEFAEDSNESGKTTNDEAQGTDSPMGTHQNKVYKGQK